MFFFVGFSFIELYIFFYFIDLCFIGFDFENVVVLFAYVYIVVYKNTHLSIYLMVKLEFGIDVYFRKIELV